MNGMRPLTRAEVKKLLNNTANLRDKTLLTIGFCTGFRISELLSLRLGDVSNAKGLINGYIKVKASNTKTKEGRTIKLNTDAIKQLTIYVKSLISKGISLEKPLFLSREGNNRHAINRTRAYQIIKSLCDKLEILGNIGTHTLRKTFAARIFESVKQIGLVQIALGHKSINSTIAYLSFSHAEIDVAIADLFN